jgi:alginate O-acetyltransferase complex protein AlgI
MHGFFLIAEDYFASRVQFKFPSLVRWITTFVIVAFAWIFFRAKTSKDATLLIMNIGNQWSVNDLTVLFNEVYKSVTVVAILSVALALLFAVESRLSLLTPDEWLASLTKPMRISFYYLLLVLIVFMGLNDSSPNFIYFNF